MHVTSDYYRCRAQRAAFCAESLTLLGEPSPAVDRMPTTTSSQLIPLSPSLRTLRGLENIYKSENQHRVA